MTRILPALILAMAAGCGRGECIDCPDVAGPWLLTISGFNLSPNCVWAAEVGTRQMAIEQVPPRGSALVLVLGEDYRLEGGILEDLEFTARRTRRTSRGAVTETRTDSMTATFSRAGDAFSGVWSLAASYSAGGQAETCGGHATVEGRKP